MEIVAVVLLPVLLELGAQRLGLTVRWVRPWWVVALCAALAAWLPAGVWSTVAAVVLLVPSLWLALGAVARMIAAHARPVQEDRGSWLLGQGAMGVGLLGPSVLGWALVARGMGMDLPDLPVARAMVGILATGLVAGESALTSGARWGRAAAGLSVVTAALSLVPGPWWLFAAALTALAVGLSMRLEVRAALPGAPGTDGLAACGAAVAAAILLPVLPALSALMVGLGLSVTAWLWRRVASRLNAPSEHSESCTCCSHDVTAGERDATL